MKQLDQSHSYRCLNNDCNKIQDEDECYNVTKFGASNKVFQPQRCRWVVERRAAALKNRFLQKTSAVSTVQTKNIFRFMESRFTESSFWNLSPMAWDRSANSSKLICTSRKKSSNRNKDLSDRRQHFDDIVFYNGMKYIITLNSSPISKKWTLRNENAQRYCTDVRPKTGF